MNNLFKLKFDINSVVEGTWVILPFLERVGSIERINLGLKRFFYIGLDDSRFYIGALVKGKMVKIIYSKRVNVYIDRDDIIQIIEKLLSFIIYPYNFPLSYTRHQIKNIAMGFKRGNTHYGNKIFRADDTIPLSYESFNFRVFSDIHNKTMTRIVNKLIQYSIDIHILTNHSHKIGFEEYVVYSNYIEELLLETIYS